MQVRASNGTRFFLKNEHMEESVKKGASQYFLLRSDLKTALIMGYAVRYGFKHVYEQFHTLVLSHVLKEGKTQRNKKYLSIGCMRFVGNERTKLLRWAKA